MNIKNVVFEPFPKKKFIVRLPKKQQKNLTESNTISPPQSLNTQTTQKGNINQETLHRSTQSWYPLPMSVNFKEKLSPKLDSSVRSRNISQLSSVLGISKSSTQSTIFRRSYQSGPMLPRKPKKIKYLNHGEQDDYHEETQKIMNYKESEIRASTPLDKIFREKNIERYVKLYYKNPINREDQQENSTTGI